MNFSFLRSSVLKIRVATVMILSVQDARNVKLECTQGDERKRKKKKRNQTTRNTSAVVWFSISRQSRARKFIRYTYDIGQEENDFCLLEILMNEPPQPVRI